MLSIFLILAVGCNTQQQVNEIPPIEQPPIIEETVFSGLAPIEGDSGLLIAYTTEQGSRSRWLTANSGKLRISAEIQKILVYSNEKIVETTPEEAAYLASIVSPFQTPHIDPDSLNQRFGETHGYYVSPNEDIVFLLQNTKLVVVNVENTKILKEYDLGTNTILWHHWVTGEQVQIWSDQIKPMLGEPVSSGQSGN